MRGLPLSLTIFGLGDETTLRERAYEVIWVPGERVECAKRIPYQVVAPLPKKRQGKRERIP